MPHNTMEPFGVNQLIWPQIQLTMTPEKTNFITQGYDGIKRLKQGPMLDSYRGLNIIHSRQYSLETGAPPRDLLRRRVRVAEYYRIPWQSSFAGAQDRVMIDLYDESRDTFFTVSWKDLIQHAALDDADRLKFDNLETAAEVQDVSAFVAVCCNQGIANLAGDYITVIRKVDLDAARFPGAPAGNAYTVANVSAASPDPLVPDDPGLGLILITNKRTFADINAARVPEIQTFYTGSGWFNGTGGGVGQFTFRNTFADPFIPRPVGGNVYNLDQKKAIFKMLAYGYKDQNAALHPQIKHGFRWD